MFAPSVNAALLRAPALARYRDGPEYIRNSLHVPPNYVSLRSAMPVFFGLIRSEPEPSVRAVPGHFLFVYLHPYFDGNGTMGRFLMNVMLASGGYPWLVAHKVTILAYLDALEEASTRANIIPFTEFLANLLVQKAGT